MCNLSIKLFPPPKLLNLYITTFEVLFWHLGGWDFPHIMNHGFSSYLYSIPILSSVSMRAFWLHLHGLRVMMQWLDHVDQSPIFTQHYCSCIMVCILSSWLLKLVSDEVHAVDCVKKRFRGCRPEEKVYPCATKKIAWVCASWIFCHTKPRLHVTAPLPTFVRSPQFSKMLMVYISTHGANTMKSHYNNRCSTTKEEINSVYYSWMITISMI